ncbi:hypothetical protein B9Z55_024867 [Caenorhabditis nigoni]|uniref:Uncharacterized protein n=1 Tax=Caenorhabditis nigoni TaxID=1611254 RepID=A0A2G5SWA6_9PELO|nr:hypothetical protein B9Z55_024867 [Caenorhabditis nigoni]
MADVEYEQRKKVEQCTAYLELGFEAGESMKQLLQLSAYVSLEVFQSSKTYEAVRKCQYSLEEKLRDRAELFMERVHVREKLQNNRKRQTDQEIVAAKKAKPVNMNMSTKSNEPAKMDSNLVAGSQSISKTSDESDIFSAKANIPLPSAPPILKNQTSGLNLNELMFKPRLERTVMYSGKSKNRGYLETMVAKVSSKNFVVEDNETFENLEPILNKLTFDELEHFLSNNRQFYHEADRLFKKFVQMEFPRQLNGKKPQNTWYQYCQQLKKDKRIECYSRKLKLDEFVARNQQKWSMLNTKAMIVI